MNHANVVYCLSEIFAVNLNLNIIQISKNELLIAKRVAEILILLSVPINLTIKLKFH